jgi:hypothetical protein
MATGKEAAMIELKSDSLVFTFPEVHPEAKLTIEFQRTLRIPDDDNDYPLPPGLGCFPLRHVDDFSENVPNEWLRRGGVMLPMYQSEAMWLRFHSNHIDGHDTSYPFAIQIAAGKINAATGEAWNNTLGRRPQDYVVVPEQPWLDGFCVEKGIVRQFVAIPLGAGYSVEEQLTEKAEHGGLQIKVYPMKRDAFLRRFPIRPRIQMEKVHSCMKCYCTDSSSMGLAPGGRMRQEIYRDPYAFADWDQACTSRCFVHLTNSLVWRAITGAQPPTVPPTSKEYTCAGFPWFEYYNADAQVLEGSPVIKRLRSIIQLAKQKGDNPLPENASVKPEHIVVYRKDLKKGQVREGFF